MRNPVPIPPPSQVELSMRTTPLLTLENSWGKVAGDHLEADGVAVGLGVDVGVPVGELAASVPEVRGWGRRLRPAPPPSSEQPEASGPQQHDHGGGDRHSSRASRAVRIWRAARSLSTAVERETAGRTEAVPGLMVRAAAGAERPRHAARLSHLLCPSIRMLDCVEC